MNTAVIVQLMLMLHGHYLTVHLVRPADPVNRPLVIYATGDGGWRGKDLQTYKQLVSWGYPLAGFSSPDYLKHLGTKTTTPAVVATDYLTIEQFAKSSLGFSSDIPIVLVGVSRGAGLSVVAAGQQVLQPVLSGVVTVGLTKEEEYVHRFRWLRLYPSLPRIAMPVMLQVYDYLPQLGTLPLAVVQSTHDQYLPASAARELFGPDTDFHRFQAIEARDHNFSNARQAMYAALQESLNWVDAKLSLSAHY